LCQSSHYRFQIQKKKQPLDSCQVKSKKTRQLNIEPRSWRGVLDTTLCDKVCQWLGTGRLFSPGTLYSSTNNPDRHDIIEILLKAAINTITLILTHTIMDTIHTIMTIEITSILILHSNTQHVLWIFKCRLNRIELLHNKWCQTIFLLNLISISFNFLKEFFWRFSLLPFQRGYILVSCSHSNTNFKCHSNLWIFDLL
jgi:hypothetical protein